MRWTLLSLTALAGVAATAFSQTAAPPVPAATAATAQRPPLLVPTIVRRLPHDPAAFTEGLIWRDGMLIESIGLEGKSEVREIDPATGAVKRRAAIPAAQFGEGLAAWKDELVSLTWHDGIAHRWSTRTLKPLGTFRYSGEGWGLTADAQGFVRSDGSATLTFHDPRTFAERRHVSVTFDGRPLTQINELEMVDGTVLANVWHQPVLVRIDPASGRVTAIVDLRAIVAEVGATDPEAVANGIAWDAARRRLFVTGKRWPTVFEITLPAR
jgi:glutamine cyclotransferase